MSIYDDLRKIGVPEEIINAIIEDGVNKKEEQQDDISIKSSKSNPDSMDWPGF
jgi:hypothetical protein